MLVGHCGQVHTDLMLAELDNIAKLENAKKGSGYFSYIKSAVNYNRSVGAEFMPLRASVVLAYGYLVLYCPADLVVQRLEQTVLPFLRQYLASFKVSANTPVLQTFYAANFSRMQRSKRRISTRSIL